MNIDANDPRWTAYALGELTDEKERAELEKILSESEEMRLMVEDIRQAAELLNEGLKSESPAALTPNQRDRIETQASKGRSWFLSRPVWALSAAAACLLMIASVWVYQLRDGDTVSAPDSLIADLRNETGPASEPVRTDVGKSRPKVEIAPTSVTVTADEENSVKETESTPAADASEIRTKDATVTGTNAPAITGTTSTQDVLAESGSSTGTVLKSQSLIEKPLNSQDVMDLINIMGGVQTAKGEGDLFDSDKTDQSFAGVDSSAIHIQQDGATNNDVRYNAGTPSQSSINPERVGEFKAVLSPVEAEAGREADKAQSVAKSGENEDAVGSGTFGPGSGGGVGSGVGRGVAGGVAGGIPGGIVGGFRQRYPAVPPPPPPGPRPPREEGRIYLPRRPVDFNTEGYENIVDNPFMEVTQNPLSTFSIDVDTASYANVRRFLDQGGLPPKDAVRIEELVNYFDYDYKGPGREGPFAAHFEMTDAPWNTEHRLLRIGLKAKEIEDRGRPATNLIFLIDVSGSMAAPNKLLLVQDAMHMLIDRLTENDHVAIVTYAGSTRVALPSTRGDRKWSIHRAVDSLRSGGSTAGASGIQLAYETAQRSFIKGGVNRVILATDGDFNVGITNHGDLARLIEEKASSGVFLSALGFGMGNYKDDTLELLADKGRGNYAYIDTIEEARKVLVEQINATLVGVAKDVKIQVEFNPARVGAYRLIGYEDRIMAKEDFNDDTRKAGVIGAGHAVTALYEIVPAGMPIPASGVDPLKYQKPVETTRAASSDEVGTVKIRYKEPEGEKSSLMEFAIRDSGRKFEKASGDFKFAASVAAFGMVLRDSPYKGSATLEHALDWAKDGKGDDLHGYRAEYIRLLHRAMSIKK